MYPSNISELISELDNQTLVEGVHVDFKVFQLSVNIDVLTRTMVAMANSGGGVIVIGIADMGTKGYSLHGLPNGIKRKLATNLKDHIDLRTKNLEWTIDYGAYGEVDFAAIFVNPSSRGMSFIHSKGDIANRSYYYRRGDKNVLIRSQFRTLYKYMTLDAAIASLEGKSWRFYEPTQWPDKFESRFYCADYSNLTQEPGSEQRVYATCVTRTQNSEAAWKVYAGKEGMQSHCIQIELDLVELLHQLFASGFRIYERRVDYMEEAKLIHIHESSSRRHAEYFSEFNFNLFLNLLALKRDAYAYENEVRYFAVPQMPEARSLRNNVAAHADLPMDWSRIIKRIRIDKNCSFSELVALRHSCWTSGINPSIKGTNLPGGLTPPVAGMKQVDVTLFNIDDMPGRKHIVIEP